MKLSRILKLYPLLLLFSACSQSESGQRPASVSIFGGQPVAKGEWNSVVSLQVGNESYCTGIAVNTTTIITAAHCVDMVGNPLEPQINVAVSSPVSTSAFLRFPLASVYYHPYYIDSFDFGMGFFNSPLASSLIDYPELVTDDELALIKANDEVVLVGFGKTESGASGKKLFTKANIVAITNDEVEIGSDAHGACNGDSGGPAFIKIGDNYKLLAIASRGQRCGKTIYGLVTSMQPWIEARQLINQGLQFLVRGDHAQAQKICEESLLYINGDVDAYQCVAQAMMAQKNYQGALDPVQQFVERAPFSELALTLSIEVHTQLGMTAEVASDQLKLKELQEKLKLSKSWAKFSVAQSAFYGKDFSGTILALDDAIGFYDQFEKYYAWRALAYEELQQYQKALVDIEAAIKLNP